MFVSDAVSVPMPADVVRRRLLAHADAGLVGTATEVFRESADAVLPAGAATWCHQVRLAGMPGYERHRTTVLALRWIAVPAQGGPYPVLDANLELTEDGSGSRLRLVGSYRVPARESTGWEHRWLRDLAEVTAHCFLVRLADLLLAP